MGKPTANIIGYLSQTTITLVKPPAQAGALRALLEAEGFTFATAPYAFFRAQSVECTVTFYEKGKLVLQGKAAGEYAALLGGPRPAAAGVSRPVSAEGDSLEPPGFPDDDDLDSPGGGFAAAMAKHPTPPPDVWIGVDETGKGDYFGPLIVAAVAVERERVPLLEELGVADSKTLTDKRMVELAKELATFCSYQKVVIGPAKYNEVWGRTKNLNTLLGWAHAKAIEGLLEKAPRATWALSDQFAADPSVVRKHMGPLAQGISWSQWPKAEADPAVAAASIMARAELVWRMRALEKEIGLPLPKGAGPPVLAAAKRLVAERGKDALALVAKLHFRTTDDVAPGMRPDVPQKPAWRRGS